MKKIRTRLLSLLLVLVTVLSLLPTAAFAASNTGSGIKITTNQEYWSTRLLANGTPYSYRPPLVDGKLVYCMDSGLGYHYATASYLNSFTWTSGTGADADAVLQSAVTNSGLSEMDAATVENVKWMMTYLNDCKASNVGQLFMAVQTYVWDHQSYKGEPGGDGDAGGYANADTYELYLSLIDWLLEQKAQEDAEFQRQIEEYTAQGKSASIVEDQSAKWAVYAISSNRKNQSFFNYYGPRKLVTQDKPGGGGEEPAPSAGVGKIVLKKTAGGTTTGLAGARFSIYFNGQIVGSDITNAQGEIYVENAATGLWSFVETSAPDGYCVDPTPKSVYVDVSEGDREYTVAAVNYEKPNMKIIKRDAMSGKPIAGTVFSIKSVTGNYSTSVTTGVDGSASLSSIPADVYVVREESVPEPYIVSNTEQTVALRPGKTSEVTFMDYEKPGLEIIKKNIANGEPIEGVTYRIEQIDGSFSTSATTDNHGRIFLESIPVGSYKVTEINVPSHIILSPIPQEVALKAGETSTVTFFNALKPTLEIRKVDSVTGDPVKGAKFQIWYGSNHTDTGELNDLGTYFSDESGKIILPKVKDGWYKVTELEAPQGYAIKEPATQECFISGGESKALTFENTPLSAIVIRKVDSESGQPLEGAWFRIRYLGGTSGTGGTVIGEYRTSSNGTIVVTGLKAGTYVCEEISAPDGYVITDATETVYISGKDQDVITVTFGNDKMGSLLIIKKDAVTGAPISDVEFFVTDSDGSVIGTANGKYVTDSAGTIRIDGLTPGTTVIAREVRAKDGYILDDTPQSIKIKRNSVMTLEFRNQPKGNLIIVKQDSITKEPLEGVQFKIVYADGSYVDAKGGTLSSTGLYFTDKEGKITLSGISGTVVVTEVQTIPGYTIDENSRTQTVTINPNDTQTLYFYNTPVGGLQIIKSDEDSGKRISGVQFEVRKMNGEIIGSYTTDSDGVIQFPELESGWYTATELKAASGYLLDTTPHRIEVKDGQTATLEITNHKSSRILLHKVDKATGKGIYGAVFLLYDSNHNPIGEYVSDQDGYLYADEGLKDGRYYLREIKAADGYVLDPELKTIYVRYGSTTEIEWTNTAECGQIQIIKKSADDNATNGLPAGTLLEGAVFEICDKAGNVVDTIKSDRNGRAVSKTLPLSRYTIREIKAPANYAINPTMMTAYLEFNGQIVTFEVQNSSISTSVSIKKTGPVQAVPNQPIRYVFSNIKNTSTVALDSFYWRDQLPAQVTLNKIVTGSYNQPLSYKVVYKTNLSHDYRTLADNLSTSKVYVLDARPAVLGLAANERVTEVMFVFGNVKAGFAQVETPYLYATARSGLANNSSIVNVADVGGLYNGQWIQAVSRWLTTVYAKTTVKLPKTGY